MNINLIESLTLKDKVVGETPPSQHEVVMLNDDYTPMEFVVSVLREVFGMTKSKALQVMFQVHYEGQARCGFYPPKEAKLKISIVTDRAQGEGFPLNCIIKRPIN